MGTIYFSFFYAGVSSMHTAAVTSFSSSTLYPSSIKTDSTLFDLSPSSKISYLGINASSAISPKLMTTTIDATFSKVLQSLNLPNNTALSPNKSKMKNSMKTSPTLTATTFLALSQCNPCLSIVVVTVTSDDTTVSTALIISTVIVIVLVIVMVIFLFLIILCRRQCLVRKKGALERDIHIPETDAIRTNANESYVSVFSSNNCEVNLSHTDQNISQGTGEGKHVSNGEYYSYVRTVLPAAKNILNSDVGILKFLN